MIDILTKNQVSVLKEIGKNSSLTKQFYLTGGTPLAAFYLQHRYSEDLDFFSEQEINVTSLNVFFRDAQKILGFTSIDFQSNLNRNLFFLQFKDETLKMEFTYYPFPRIERGAKEYGIEVDSLLDIAVNKLFTIYQRTKARDYIDLFMICQKTSFTIADLTLKAKAKFDWHIDPLQLGTQFMKAQEAPDLPRMIAVVPEEAWQKFFLEEAKKLKADIFE
ncbi:MAG: nucleotidyl transferase AbiEii/AbiGii toxin family protein [Patescibacteria group bacterium]